MTEWSAFKNCTGFTDEQVTVIALVRGTVAAVCCAVLFTLLVVLGILAKCYFQKVCGTVVKRLTIGLTVATVPYLLFNAIPERESKFCIADGFFEQYFGSYEILFTLAISMVLFLKILKATTITSQKLQDYFARAEESTIACRSWKINKLEIALYVSMFILPLLLQWIPFTTNSYGPFGAWCWIRKYNMGCSIHRAGMVERVVLWGLPFTLVTILSFTLLIVSLCLMVYTKIKKQIKIKVRTVAIDSLLSQSLLFGFCTFQAAVYTSALGQDRFTFWLLYAALLPLGAVFIPLALLATVHLPLSSTIACTRRMCWRQHNGNDDQAEIDPEEERQVTVRRNSAPSQPSETTFEPKHSSYLVSGFVPMEDEEQQED